MIPIKIGKGKDAGPL